MRHTEIDIIRSILVIVLIAYHACCPYFASTWEMPSALSQANIGSYTFAGTVLYNGMLEAFVCISGFLFARSIKDALSIAFWKKKVIRLYLPCVLWGIGYSLFFVPQTNIYNILNGEGHLWFLPMLMWLFALELCLNKILANIAPRKNSILLPAIIALIPYPTLPLRLNTAMYFLLFFHCGVQIFNNFNSFKTKIQSTSSYIIVCVFTFTIIICWIKMTIGSPYDGQPILQKMFQISSQNILKILGGACMIFLYWRTALWIQHIASRFAIIHRIALCSFGIYILQEFLLRLFYYNTPICDVFGDFTPLVLIPIVFLVSTITTMAMQRFKLAKFLIGG